MTFYEQELRKIIGEQYPDATYVGRVCYVRLSDMNRAKIQFVTGSVANQYNALQLTILNRSEGQVTRSPGGGEVGEQRWSLGTPGRLHASGQRLPPRITEHPTQEGLHGIPCGVSGALVGGGGSRPARRLPGGSAGRR